MCEKGISKKFTKYSINPLQAGSMLILGQHREHTYLIATVPITPSFCQVLLKTYIFREELCPNHIDNVVYTRSNKNKYYQEKCKIPISLIFVQLHAKLLLDFINFFYFFKAILKNNIEKINFLYVSYIFSY